MSRALATSVEGGSGAMFDAIARRYDAVNRVVSFGRDQSWRRRAVRALDLGDADGKVVLDLATGTGDLALAVKHAHPGATVVGIDPSTGMLDIARAKAASAEVSIAFREGDATHLDVEDASVDGIAMAFGIRNVKDRPAALVEMARVARPNARVVLLELTEPRGALGALARTWVHAVVPRIGALMSGAAEYGYLERSIAAFPAPEAFAQTIARAGLDVLEMVPLSFGAACLFVALKPAR